MDFEEIGVIDFNKLLSGDGDEYKLPDATQYNYWEARVNRIFYIDYEIEDDYALLELSKTIIQLNFAEKDIPQSELKPIYICLHSFGGDISQSLFMCDLIKSSRIPIITIGMGACMSAGFLLFLAGHKRYAFPHTRMLVHSGSAQFGGTAEQIDEAQKDYKKQIEEMKQYVLENTDIDEKTFNKNKTKDWYLDKNDLEKYNIATIVDDINMIFNK